MFNISNFEDARSALRKTLAAAIICCVCSLFLPDSMAMLRLGLVCTAIVFFIFTVYVLIKYCRCPKCHKQILFGALAVKNCPRCRRNLVTGKKR